MVGFFVAVLIAAIILYVWLRRRETLKEQEAEWTPGFSLQITSSIRQTEADDWRSERREQRQTRRKPQYQISYADENGEVTEREIAVIRSWREDKITYFDSWCFLRGDERTFRSDRILSAFSLQDDRAIDDIAAHRRQRRQKQP